MKDDVIELKRVENGFVLKTFELWEGDEPEETAWREKEKAYTIPRSDVGFSDEDEKLEMAKTLVDAFWDIAERFSLIGWKHDKYDIIMKVEKRKAED